ncbi:MAG: hypothetical protein ACJ8C4_06575 [Gemmataceae bacterium]
MAIVNVLMMFFRNGLWAASLVDAVLLLFVIGDLARFWPKDLSVLFAVEHIPYIVTETIQMLFYYGLAVLFGLPVVFGVVVRIWDLRGLKQRRIRHDRRLAFAIHTVAALLMAFGFLLGRAMQDVSGLLFDGQHFSYAYESYQQTTVSHVIAAVAWLVPIALAATQAVSQLSPTSTFTTALQQYLTRAHLDDFPGRFAPTYGNNLLDFNAGMISPEIRCIAKNFQHFWREYNNSIPGSGASAEVLQKMADKSRTAIRSLFFHWEPAGKVKIDFFPGTCRAIEHALLRIPGPKLIIVSPFEHQVVVQLATAFCTSHKASARIAIPANPSWRSQEEKSHDEIVRILQQNANDKTGIARTPVLILSDVCSTTGHVVPVISILDALAAKLKARNQAFPHVILDAAHFECGPSQILNRSWDDRIKFVVLSAHKWLLSPEPCGILLYLEHVVGQLGTESPLSYDAWIDGNGLPNSTVSARGIIGLHASLKTLTDENMAEFRRRRRLAVELFLELTKEKLRVVRPIVGRRVASDMSSMITVRPKPNWKWEQAFSAKELQELLEGHGVYVRVFDGDERGPWVRICFFHFVDTWKVKTLAQRLFDELVPRK